MTMKHRILVCVLFLGLLAGCAPSGVSAGVDLVFAEFRFNIPESPSAIGVQGNGLFTALRYGAEPGKNYLTFADRPPYPAAGCPPEVFFAQFMESENPVNQASCDPDQVRHFSELMAESALEHGLWQSSANLTAFYLVQASKTMVFLMGGNGAFVKIESDFMDLGALEEMVMGTSQR